MSIQKTWRPYQAAGPVVDIWRQTAHAASKLPSILRVPIVTDTVMPAVLIEPISAFWAGLLSGAVVEQRHIRLGSQSARPGKNIRMMIRIASQTRNGNAAVAT